MCLVLPPPPPPSYRTNALALEAAATRSRRRERHGRGPNKQVLVNVCAGRGERSVKGERRGERSIKNYSPHPTDVLISALRGGGGGQGVPRGRGGRRCP